MMSSTTNVLATREVTDSISRSSGSRAAISSAEIVPGGWTCLEASLSFLSSRLDFAGAADCTIISSTFGTSIESDERLRSGAL